MKQYIKLIAVATLCAVGAVGCGSLLEHKAPQTSLPVLTGAATTNDVNSVAWLQYASLLNRTANPTPTQQPIEAALYALIGLASAAAGWTARHTAAKAEKNQPKPG